MIASEKPAASRAVLRSFFDRSAATYDARYLRGRTIFDGEKHRRLELLLRCTGAHRPRRLLDVGCGTGVVARSICSALKSAEVVGIDFSFEMLRQAGRGGHPRVLVLQADAMHVPFREASFDFVYALGVMDYVSPHQRTLVEAAYALLGEEGAFVFTHPNGRSLPRRLRDGLRRRLKPATAAVAARPVDAADVARALTDAGFEIISSHFITYGLGLVAWPWSIALSRLLESILAQTRLAEPLAWSVLWVARKPARGRGTPQRTPIA
jgi:SAM-dependent methyltransferase